MVSIINALTPIDGVLTGGQPTQEQLQDAKELGFKTIINLRGVGEAGTDVEPGIVANLGMAYHHLPINGAAGITFENAEAFGRLMDASDGPIMVHCASGNRVGALFAIKSYRVDGASAEDALALGYRAGLTGLQGYVRQLLDV